MPNFTSFLDSQRNNSKVFASASTETLIPEKVKKIERDLTRNESKCFLVDEMIKDPKAEEKKSPRKIFSKTNSFASKSSAASFATKNFQFPHALGSRPSYLRKTMTSSQKVKPESSTESTRNISTSPLRHVSQINDKSTETDNTSNELTKKIDELTETLCDLRKGLTKSKVLMKKKDEEIKTLQTNFDDQKKSLMKYMTRNDAHKNKIQKLEVHLSKLKRSNEELKKTASEKVLLSREATSEVELLKQQLKMTSNINASLVSDKNRVEQELRNSKEFHENDSLLGVKIDVDQQVEDLKNKLMDHEVKMEFMRYAKDNSTETSEIGGKFDFELMQLEIFHLKKKDENLQLELNDERLRNQRLENLLQLRCEYIKTLQDTDEINKTRQALQLQEMEGLRQKYSTMKKLRLAAKEELCNLYKLHNSINSMFEKKFAIIKKCNF